MLAGPSLAFGWTSTGLLIQCLEYVWKFRPATPVDEEHPWLPWNTKSLTLLGGNTQWTGLTNTPQGAAFLASIRQLSSPMYLSRGEFELLHLAKEYPLPQWVNTIPLAAFEGLQTVVSPYQIVIPPTSQSELMSWGVDVHLQVLTLPATLLRARTGIPKAMKGFVDVLPGQGSTRSDNDYLRVSDFTGRWHPPGGWERIWAYVL
jgi:hypothetical protein